MNELFEPVSDLDQFLFSVLLHISFELLGLKKQKRMYHDEKTESLMQVESQQEEQEEHVEYCGKNILTRREY